MTYRLGVDRELARRRRGGDAGAAALRARHVRVHAGAPARHRHGPGGQGARHRRLRAAHMSLRRLFGGEPLSALLCRSPPKYTVCVS